MNIETVKRIRETELHNVANWLMLTLADEIPDDELVVLYVVDRAEFCRRAAASLALEADRIAAGRPATVLRLVPTA